MGNVSLHMTAGGDWNLAVHPATDVIWIGLGQSLQSVGYLHTQFGDPIVTACWDVV